MSKGIVKTSFLISGIGILGKPLALLREILMAAIFGADHRTDAYLIGATIPNQLMNLITGGAFTSAFIPVFAKFLAKDKEEEGWRCISSILNFVVFLMLGITVVGLMASPLLVRIFAPGFDHKTLQLATILTRFMLPATIFLGLAHIFKCILNTYKHFTLPAIQPLLLNISLILMMLLFSKRLGIYSMVIGLILGALTHLVLQAAKIKKKFHLYRPVLRSEGSREFLLLILPLMPWMVVSQMSGVVNKAVASTLATGSITVLHFASRIKEGLINLFGVSIATAAFPYLSTSASLDRWEEFSKNLNNSLKMLLFITLPICFFLTIYPTPIIRTVYQRGLFDETATRLASFALLFYAIGLPAMASKRLLMRAYFATRSVREPTTLDLMCLGANILLSIILSRSMGVGGIALATSISEVALFFLLINSLKRRFGVRLEGLYRFLLIGGGASLVAVFSCFYLFYHLLHIEDELIGLILGSSFSGLIYLSLCLIFKLEEVRRLANLILRRKG